MSVKSIEQPHDSDPAAAPQDAEAFKYELLVGHNRTNGTPKSDRQLRMEYITLTDKLIATIQDGATVQNKQTGEIEHAPFDTVIFLDKSARPVSWLVREMWDRLAVEDDGEVTPMPKINFLNIDREQWIASVDEEGTGVVDVDHLSPNIIRSLRSIFVAPQVRNDKLTEVIDTAPATIDGKNVLIVDEVRSTGRTMKIATKLLERAFPKTHFEGAYWMGGLAAKLAPRNGGISYGNPDLPVWYRENLEAGRGVGDRRVDLLPNDASPVQRLGRWFLSTRIPGGDPLGNQLRSEIHHLATQPDVPIRPSYMRDNYDERLVQLNGTNVDIANAAIKAILNDN